MFTCPNCNSTTHKLIADGRQNTNGTWLKCGTCSTKNDISYDGIRHQTAGNKHCPTMTEIDKRHIECRTIAPGGQVVYTDPRLRTSSHR